MTLSFKTLSDLPLQSYTLTNKNFNLSISDHEFLKLDTSYDSNIRKSLSVELGESDLFSTDTLNLVVDLTSRKALNNPSTGYFSVVKYSPTSLSNYDVVGLDLRKLPTTTSVNLYSYMNVIDKSFTRDLRTLFMIINK